MDYAKSSLRRILGPDFTRVFREILYSNKLTFGAKCLAFSILDSPPGPNIKNSVLAYRLKSDPAQVSVWRKELIRHHLDPRADKPSVPRA